MIREVEHPRCEVLAEQEEDTLLKDSVHRLSLIGTWPWYNTNKATTPQTIAFFILFAGIVGSSKISTFSHSPDASPSTWQWQYNTSVCFDDGENATLTWRVTLNSGEEIGAVSIWQQPVKAGGSPVQMYGTISGKEPAFSDQVMSLLGFYSGSSSVYDVVFTLKGNNSKDGFGTIQLQCRVTSTNFLELGSLRQTLYLKCRLKDRSGVAVDTGRQKDGGDGRDVGIYM
ncbi:predicted protein [Nematostella vectensis]|uniref:Uncharacterized protein n=1 Tax=Nematostella vectensis TaxID=45351 RepID=A7T4Z0_NEMVE|nr:predicted protein [Nematostella vectensis]|eukprot:XP_001621073.1 hypothetical protein NEMVEDRAFT_v1g222397 [Nematostella vectensis]